MEVMLLRKNMMKNTKKIRRQEIREVVARVSPWELSGTAHEIYKELQETQNVYVDKYNVDDIISVFWEWEADNYDNSGEFALNIRRLENDKEYDARVKKLIKIKDGEKLEKQKQEQSEYETYLRLQKRFKNKN